jgi:hypothetical protein
MARTPRIAALVLLLISCQADPPPKPVMDVKCENGNFCPHGMVCTPDSKACTSSVFWCADKEHWCSGGQVCTPDNRSCVDRLSWCPDGIHWCSGGLVCSDDNTTCLSRHHDDGVDMLPVYIMLFNQ